MAFECGTCGLWADECPYNGVDEDHPIDQQIERIVKNEMRRVLGMDPFSKPGKRFVTNIIGDLAQCAALIQAYKTVMLHLHTDLGMHGHLDFHGRFAAGVSSKVVEVQRHASTRIKVLGG